MHRLKNVMRYVAHCQWDLLYCLCFYLKDYTSFQTNNHIPLNWHFIFDSYYWHIFRILYLKYCKAYFQICVFIPTMPHAEPKSIFFLCIDHFKYTAMDCATIAWGLLNLEFCSINILVQRFVVCVCAYTLEVFTDYNAT